MEKFQSSLWVVQLESSIGKQVCTQDDVAFDVVFVKDKNLLLIDAPVLSNSGNL